VWNWKSLAIFGIEFLILGVLANITAHIIIRAWEEEGMVLVMRLPTVFPGESIMAQFPQA
jgi:hypothetical protein